MDKALRFFFAPESGDDCWIDGDYHTKMKPGDFLDGTRYQYVGSRKTHGIWQGHFIFVKEDDVGGCCADELADDEYTKCPECEFANDCGEYKSFMEENKTKDIFLTDINNEIAVENNDGTYTIDVEFLAEDDDGNVYKVKYHNEHADEPVVRLPLNAGT